MQVGKNQKIKKAKGQATKSEAVAPKSKKAAPAKLAAKSSKK